SSERAEHHAEDRRDRDKHDVRVGQLSLRALPGRVVDDQDERAEERTADEAADRAFLPPVVLEAREVPARDGEDREDRVSELADAEQPAADGAKRGGQQNRQEHLQYE